MTATTLPPWQPANNGAGKRIWFLYREGESLSYDQRYHYATDGRLVRYASYDSAKRAADRLNAGAA